jgi:hypothetical protein
MVGFLFSREIQSSEMPTESWYSPYTWQYPRINTWTCGQSSTAGTSSPVRTRAVWVRPRWTFHVPNPVNSMSFIWNDNMREKREANANATWRALIRDRPRGDGV